MTIWSSPVRFKDRYDPTGPGPLHSLIDARPIQIDFYTVETQQDFKDLFVLDLQEEMERLSDVQNLVMQLYEALHVNEHQLKKERQLVTQLEQLHTQLLPLEEVLQDF